MKDRNVKFRNLAIGVFAAIMIFTAVPTFAQDEAVEEDIKLDRELVPETGANLIDFVPKGWKIEEEITGDVNADKVPDHLLALVEDKPAVDKDDMKINRNRALVIVLADKEGHLTRGAVASSLLQCTGCGGAFYGVLDAPAEVTIEKGVIVVNQEHGSRFVSNTTLRFRYSAGSNEFLLIGYDYGGRDRAEASVATESTNYTTGSRITYIGKGKKNVTTRSRAVKAKISIEDVDSEKLEEEASARMEKN